MKRKKVFKIFFIFGLLFVLPFIVLADDFEVPHRIEAGDIISADVINEINDQIQQSLKTYTSSDLLGTWSCKAVTGPMGNQTYEPEWEIHDSVYIYLTDVTLTFQEDGDGTYSLTTSTPNPFRPIVGTYCKRPGFTTRYAVYQNILFLDRTMGDNCCHDGEGGCGGQYIIRRLGSYRILLSNPTIPEQSITNAFLCDKNNIPPAKPTNLEASTSETNVTLSWTDNSDDETGFKILRRGSLTGNYNVIETTDANAITSPVIPQDMTPTCWYRVKSTNANGDSVGSNVVKVTVSD